MGGAFLLCTGSEDPLCTPGQLFAFTSALQDAGVDCAYAFTVEPSTFFGPLRCNLSAH